MTTDRIGKGKTFRRGADRVRTARKQGDVRFGKKPGALLVRSSIDHVVSVGVTAGRQNDRHRPPEFVQRLAIMLFACQSNGDRSARISRMDMVLPEMLFALRQ